MENLSEIESYKRLGSIYSKESTTFRVWAPTRDQIKLYLYDKFDDLIRKEYTMVKDEDGVFEFTLEGDLDGKFYMYGVDDMLVTDPNAHACAVNSSKSAIIDLDDTNPEGFLEHFIPFNDRNKAVIAEAHLADISINENSGAEYRGTFLGLAQEGTEYKGLSTGLDHISELGISHIHLLPITDYLTVDERKPLKDYSDNFNWGYDQELYSCLEGSFSTDPYDPKARIREFKTLVMKLHEKNISVVLDVVYNHTYRSKDSNFNCLVPDYYYRQDTEGNFSNGSGCGNELASERPMVRKFIVDSLCFLAKEYKLDGFRFDLMALIDIDTILLAKQELEKINPNILIYGEPWMALGSPLAYDKQINIGSQKGKDFAIFNPFFRDAIKGDNDGSKWGYIQGDFYLKEAVQNGIRGSVNPIDYKDSPFASPLESINYFNAHDNLIFYDKLVKSGVSEDFIGKMTVSAFSILLMSQGKIFFHLGNEFLRTKYMDHNSYKSSSHINGIDWSLKEKNIEVFNTVKDLIKLRNDLKIFNMETAEEVSENISFLSDLKDYLIAYTVKGDERTYLIVHNLSNNREFIDKRLLNTESLRKIWSNAFVDVVEDEIYVDGFTSNVYVI